MNALMEHGFGDSHDSWADRNARRELAVEALAERLRADYWQDLEQLSDAFNDAGSTIAYYRSKEVPHPLAVTFLTLARDGSDDAELGRMLREAMRDYISDKAADDAEERTPA